MQLQIPDLEAHLQGLLERMSIKTSAQQKN